MKKLFYLLFLLPLAFLASCNSDDDLPQVELTFTMSNVYQNGDNGQFYYVMNDETEPQIDGLSAKTLIDGKNAGVANVFYNLNGYVRLFGTEEKPFQPVVPTEYLRNGENYINVSAMVLQVDKTMADCAFTVPLNVVESTEDLPATVGELGTYSCTLRMAPGESK